MKVTTIALAAAVLAGLQGNAFAVNVATFDDLPLLPALNGGKGLFFANGGNASYAGVVWESGLEVVGDESRVDIGDPTVPRPPGPLFGVPHSGHYFLTNQGNGVTNDGMLLTTSLVMTSAWFGRNEYYGFGGGADQITINALGASGVLGSVSFDLPEANAGAPEPLSFVDTGVFAGLRGITGYRIDRRELGTQSGNWVADDFTFVTAAPVPEPESWAMLLAGLCSVLGFSRRRAAAMGAANAHNNR